MASFDRNRETEQPVTQGVLFTQMSLVKNATEFTGPVHVVTAAQDWPFCFLNCYAVPEGSPYPSVPAYVKELYPATKNFSVYIPANFQHQRDELNAVYSFVRRVDTALRDSISVNPTLVVEY